MSEERLLGLTDDEWIRLIDGDSEDSLLQVCCANISALRDQLISMLRGGRFRKAQTYEIQLLQRNLKWVVDGHDVLLESPIFKKLIDAVGGLPEEHESQKIE